MAKYNIKRLNYISSGEKRSFINLDMELDTGIDTSTKILRREVNKVDVLSGNIVTEYYTTKADNFIRIYLKGDNSSYNEKQVEFISKYVKRYNQTFFYDEDIDSKSDNTNNMDEFVSNINIRPIYDINDVCIKSDMKTSKSTILTMDASKTEDRYLPQNSENPIQFSQNGGNSYFLYPKTNQSENILKTSLQDTTLYSNSQYYYVYLDSGKKIKTILYKSHKEISSGYDFEPERTIQGINYNRLIKIDNNVTSYGTYINGNQYGQIFKLKNQYDATYSMNMDSSDSLINCRDYCGIDNDSENLYLKYYDNVDYVIENNQAVSQKTYVYPYQKIEYFIPNSMQSNSKHKTNFFSIRFCNSPLDSGDEKYNSIQFKQLRKDIINAVRDICQNIAPINTQLFSVQFSQEGN